MKQKYNGFSCLPITIFSNFLKYVQFFGIMKLI